MFFIVNLHVLGQGGAMARIPSSPQTYYALWFVETCAYCAVDLYGLLSGYVGVDGKYRPVRILELWLQVFFYSAGITLLYWMFAPGLLETDSLWKAIFPMSWKTYWYFSSYVGVFVLMPYLNKMMNSLSQREIRRLAVTLFLLFSVGTALPKINGSDFLQLIGGYSFAWLFLLYLFGACLKKMEFPRWRKRWYLVSYFGLVAFSWIFKIVVENYTREVYGEARYGRLFTGYCAPTIFLSAVCLFLIFEQLEIRGERGRRWIAWASPLAFSVYLIHTQPLIWSHILKGAFGQIAYWPPYGAVPAALLAAGLIYLVCSLIDGGRRWLFVKGNVRGRLERITKGI